jgi:hypothetical protein
MRIGKLLEIRTYKWQATIRIDQPSHLPKSKAREINQFMQILRRLLLLIFALYLTPLAVAPAKAEMKESTKEILQKVIENEKKNRRLQTSYIYEMSEYNTKLDKKGQVKETVARTYEIIPLDEGVYRKLIKKNGQPLSATEAKKEEKRIEKEFKKHENLTAAERDKMGEKKAKRLREEEHYWNEVLNAYNINQTGSEILQGRTVTVFDFVPRPQYHPSDWKLKALKSLKGCTWVDDLDSQIVRLEINVVEDLKLAGGLLAKVEKGGSIAFTQQKINDEVWFPTHSEVLLNMRILLLKGLNVKVLSDFANYRKYETNVKILPSETSAKEIP